MPRLMAIFLLLALAACSAMPVNQAADVPSGELRAGTRAIDMSAKRFEFIPKRIVVQSGENVLLTITALDTAHGFSLDAYGINRTLEPNRPETISFTAGAPGVFPFHCSVFCGLGHFGMDGELIVLPAGTNGR
jgi:cytochrome c oxidase subunit II